MSDGINPEQQTPQNVVNVNVTAPQPNIGVRQKTINAVAYLLLAIFLGGIGVHRFYRGSIGMGILYIFTAGLFGIGWLVDIILAIVYLTQAGPNQEIHFVNKKYAPINN